MTDLTVLSLGAGVQSTALALMGADGTLPKPDVAIFADTGWEPKAVMEHLDTLERDVLEPAGIELHRVDNGNIRAEALDDAYSVHLPLFIKTTSERGVGTIRRQCTANYKLVPIYRKIRELLGGKRVERECRYCAGEGTRTTPWSIKRGEPHHGVCSVCHGSGVLVRVGVPPKHKHAEQWIGFSTDEVGRVGAARVPYVTSAYPLLDLNMSRADCTRYLLANGWRNVVKSACIGCPFHGNAQWRDIRDNDPEAWQDAVYVDGQVRRLPGKSRLDGEGYLHSSLLPLDEAPIDRVSKREWNDRQVDLLELLADDQAEHGSTGGCSPFGCRSGDPVDVPDELLLADEVS